MNGNDIYFLFGGFVFVIIFVFFYHLIKKLRNFFKKSYQPKTPSSFKCLDGHIVRSKGELIIDNFLHNNNIHHHYEKIIKVRGKPIKCDWYLPKLDIYIEYWGYFGKEYMKRKEEKLKLYKQGKLTLLSIENIMFKDIYSNLEKYFNGSIKIKNNTEKKHCPFCGVELDNRF